MTYLTFGLLCPLAVLTDVCCTQLCNSSVSRSCVDVQRSRRYHQRTIPCAQRHEWGNGGSTQSRYFDWIGQDIIVGDVLFEEKKREDGYERTPPEDSPYTVLLAAVYDEHGESQLCTGSLLTGVWVLTAGHCLTVNNSSPSKVILYAGGNSLDEVKARRPARGSQLQQSREIYVHPEYFTREPRFDVALVKSSRAFFMTKTVNVVTLYDKPWPFTGYKECNYTGYGRVMFNGTHPDDMTRKTQRLSMDCPCHCAAAVSRGMKDPEVGHYLCAKPEEDVGLCVGDSGGGVLCDGRLMGTALRLIELGDPDTCEDPHDDSDVTCGGRNTLSVFLNIHPYHGWISSYIKQPVGPVTGPPRPEHDGGGDVTPAAGLLTLSLITHIVHLLYE